MKFVCRWTVVALYMLSAMSVSAQEDLKVERILITGNTPLDADAELDGQILNSDNHKHNAASFGNWLERSATGVTVSYPQGNPAQPELSYRGYSISGLLGLPQALAVYQNGTRINETFGDVVNFDSVPVIAIDRLAIVSGSDPLFGLNALGGAIAVNMKNGYSHQGRSIGVRADSLAQRSIEYEDAKNFGHMAMYLAGTFQIDDGWRDFSASSNAQLYGDLRFKNDAQNKDQIIGVSFTHSSSSLNGNGTAPIQLIEQKRSAVFTHPDNTGNSISMVQFYANRNDDDRFKLDLNASYRRLRQTTFNGDEADFGECNNTSGLNGYLCFPNLVDPARDINGQTIMLGNIGDEPYGANNRSVTSSDAFSGSFQLTWRAQNFPSELTAGGGGLTSTTDFQTSSEIGRLNMNRGVTGSSIRLGGNQFNTRLTSTTTSVYGFAGTALQTENITTKLTAQVTWTRIKLEDRIGTDLDGDHQFSGINASAHTRFRMTDSFSVFGRASQNSRTPSPAELSCADENRPCRFPNAFLADPPLNQVVAQTLEAGADAKLDITGGRLAMTASAFLGNNNDDIIFVSSGPVVGSGYFRNAGQTRREGIEARAMLETGPLILEIGYAYINATFQSALTILAADNPNANNNGEISVQPGDRIPLIPLHSTHATLQWSLAPNIRTHIGFNSVSERFYRGDEANQAQTLPGYVVARASIEATLNDDRLTLQAGVTNALNTNYATFGTFGEADEINFTELNTQPDDPRFITPSPPLSITASINYRF